MPRFVLSALALFFFCGATPAAEPAPEAQPLWLEWSNQIFERAQKEHKLVLLDLGTGWCHWCHVMEKETYANPDVLKLLAENFLAVKVDADKRPDLANRYEDYGWPATILFDSKGQELAKRRGYIPPLKMAAMLDAFVKDPTPGPSVTGGPPSAAPAKSALGAEEVKALEASLVERYDFENGGWGRVHKYLYAEGVEYCLSAIASNPKFEAMAQQNLDKNLVLIDPTWGGVYQYSDGGVWENPHFEKIMSQQAANLRLYTLAYAQTRNEHYLKAAQDVRKFLKSFLTSSDGAFFVSMDADVVPGEHSGEYFALDDAGRRKVGMPRVDKNLYARENGWAIEALCEFYAVTADETALSDAKRAAEWIVKQRVLGGGGFAHGGELDPAGPYLGDSLAMGQAFLALYSVTGERAWLTRAEAAANFIAAKFPAALAGEPPAGFVSEAVKADAPFKAAANYDENLNLARFANLLAHYTGKEAAKKIAAQALRFVSIPEMYVRRHSAGLLLAQRELANEPLHVVVVGKKDEANARALFMAAVAIPRMYKQVEWYDAKEGTLPGADLEYPQLDQPAAYLCVDGRCSAPLDKPEDLTKRVAELLAPKLK